MEQMRYLRGLEMALTRVIKEVWNQYHGGLLEGVYQDVVAIELSSMGVIVQTEVDIPMYHKNVKLKHQYRADMVVADDILVEFKAVKCILPEHRAQLFNYLRLTKKPLGVLVNFSVNEYKIERWLFDSDNNTIMPYTF